MPFFSPLFRWAMPTLLSCAALVTVAAETDPILAFRQQLFQTLPVGKNLTGDVLFKDLAGAKDNHFDVPYLGPERDRLYRVSLDQRDPRARAGHPFGLEWRTRCNIHLPPGPGPFPVLIGVHGGSYQGGSKDGGNMWGEGMPAACMARGIAWVKINYILGHGIHPQVQRDVRELVRFLREQAATYRLDPHRIGVMGSSAGGWLTGSSSFTTVDDPWIASSDWRYRTVDLDTPDKRMKPGQLLLPGDAIAPQWPARSARVSVAIADFVDGLDRGSPDDPHFFGFVNPGQPGCNAQRQSNGHLVTRVILSKEGTHLPNSSQLVDAADGSRKIPMFDRLLAFVDAALIGPQALAPAPEARPNQRWFTDQIEVSLVGSGPGAAIHYTTDGSEPSPASPRYERPFTLTATTTVMAIAVVPGMQPSGAMTARFRQGPLPPAITGPTGVLLPPARVGQPYDVRFTAPGAQRWWCAMQTAGGDASDIPTKVHSQVINDYFLTHGLGARNGLKMAGEGETGVLRGTPRLPGWTTVLVVAATAPGQGCPVAGDRLYMLRIDPDPAAPIQKAGPARNLHTPEAAE